MKKIIINLAIVALITLILLFVFKVIAKAVFIYGGGGIIIAIILYFVYRKVFSTSTSII